MNNNATTTLNTDEDGSYDNTGQPVGSFGYGLGLSLGILFIFVILTYISYTCKSRRDSRNNSNNRVRRRYVDASSSDDSTRTATMFGHHQSGLDESTIKSYPEFEYSRVRPQPHEVATSGCSICLADYKDGDLLRMLPDCGHMFHAKCLDPWLSINPTCPICRSSPARTPPLVETDLSGGGGDLPVIRVH